MASIRPLELYEAPAMVSISTGQVRPDELREVVLFQRHGANAGGLGVAHGRDRSDGAVSVEGDGGGDGARQSPGSLPVKEAPAGGGAAFGTALSRAGRREPVRPRR